MKNFRSLLFLTGGLWGLCVQAYFPGTGQIARHQSNLLRNEKPFKLAGAAILPGRPKVTLELQWQGPSTYQVTLSNLPKNLYAEEAGSTRWTLYRSLRGCVLKTEAMAVNCGPAEFWAHLELGGRPDASVRSLVDRGFYSESDAVYAETDSKTYKVADKDNQRVKLVVGTNGVKPGANLEIRGPTITSDLPGEDYPLIQFDQTFLSPLFARFKTEGDVITIRASADLEVRRNRPRFKYILSERLDVSSGKNLIATFVRSEPQALPKVVPTIPPKAITELNSFKAALSVEGQNFLKAFLLTH